MDTYIVRIYRRDADRPGMIIGLVEEVGIEEKRPFKGIDELQEILMRRFRKIHRSERSCSNSKGMK